MGKKYLETKKDSLEASILDVWKQAAEFTETNKNDKSDDGEGLDAVQPKAVKKKFKDRKDKDIDNDGDVDDSDKFLHKRRKAVSKAVAKEEVELDEGYEKTVLLALKDEGIEGHFSDGVLYVAKRDIKNAKDAIKAAGHIKVAPKIMGEEVELDEAPLAKQSHRAFGYELYHKDFSSAMQHAYKMAKKNYGITVDPKEIDDKVASGPRKPSEGKTNKYRLKGDKGAIQVQVYNKGGSKPFELNMYEEEVELEDNVEEYAQNAYFKVQSMKAALAKVWGMEEGHNPFAEHKGTKPHKHPHDEEDEVEEGLEDSPNSANKQHLCAKNVVHEEWGSGQCISTQHAEPDEEGNVAWYDVMFEHGIEKGVSINELKVTKAEGHMHASHDPKKKMKKTETGKKPAAIDLKPKIDDK